MSWLKIPNINEKDFNNKEIGPLLKKYLKTHSGVNVEDRFKLIRFLENATMGTTGVSYKTESMHGAGSPQAQRIMIARQSNIEQKKELIKHILDI